MSELLTYFFFYDRFPDEWSSLRNIGNVCIAFVGMLAGLYPKVSNWRNLVYIVAIFIATLLASITFDAQYFFYMEDYKVTLTKPIYGCDALQNYLELDFPKEISATIWYQKVHSPDCWLKTYLTICISTFISYIRTLFLFTLLILLVRIFLSSLKFKFSFLNFKLVFLDKKLQLSVTKTGGTDQCHYSVDSLDDDSKALLNQICGNITQKMYSANETSDACVFRDFIYKVTNRHEDFIAGFHSEGKKTTVPKVDYHWSSFKQLTAHGIGTDSSKAVLCWAAEFTNTDLQQLIVKFVEFYDKKGKNPDFFKGVKKIAERAKQEAV